MGGGEADVRLEVPTDTITLRIRTGLPGERIPPHSDREGGSSPGAGRESCSVDAPSLHTGPKAMRIKKRQSIATLGARRARKFGRRRRRRNTGRRRRRRRRRRSCLRHSSNSEAVDHIYKSSYYFVSIARIHGISLPGRPRVTLTVRAVEDRLANDEWAVMDMVLDV